MTHWQLLGKPTYGSRIGRIGLLSKGLLKTSMWVKSPCPATSKRTRLGNEGATTADHSNLHLKQKVLSECERRSSILDASVSQTYSRKTNNLPFLEIG